MTLNNIWIDNNEFIRLPGTAIHFNDEYSIINLLIDKELVYQSKMNEYIVIKNCQCYGLKGKCSLNFKNGLLEKIIIQIDKRCYRPDKSFEEVLKQAQAEVKNALSTAPYVTHNKNYYIFRTLIVQDVLDKNTYKLIISQK